MISFINTEPIKKFGENVANYFSTNSSDNDFIMLCVDDNIFKQCISGIDPKELETALKKIKLRYNYGNSDFIPIAIAAYQVKLFSDMKCFNEETEKSNALKESFCKFYNLDSNEMWREERSNQSRLWKRVKEIFYEKYKRKLIYKNKSFYDNTIKNDYVGCPKSQLFFLNNNIQLLFYSINKRLIDNKQYSLNEIKYLVSSSRLFYGLQFEIYRKLQEFTDDYIFSLSQLNTLFVFMIYVFSNNRDPNIFKNNYIEFYQQDLDEDLDEQQFALTLKQMPNNDYVINIFWESKQLLLDIDQIENHISQMLEENYFLYFDKKLYYWECTNILSQLSFSRNFVLITTSEYFFSDYTFKSSCGKFVAYTYENVPDELIKKLNTEILGKVYKESYLLGGIKTGSKEYLQNCTPWINPEKCKNIPDLSEANFYCIQFDDGHKENILVRDNTPDGLTTEIVENTNIGWDLDSANLKNSSSSNVINGLLCSFSAEDRKRVTEDRIISTIGLFANKSIMNHFMKIQYHEFDKESSVYRLIRRGKYGF